MKALSTCASFKVVALVAAMTAASGIASTAQANWISKFLCAGDNNPKQCKDHLPDWLKNLYKPAPNNPQTAKLVAEAKKLQGQERLNFLNRNAEKLGGPRTALPLKENAEKLSKPRTAAPAPAKR